MVFGKQFTYKEILAKKLTKYKGSTFTRKRDSKTQGVVHLHGYRSGKSRKIQGLYIYMETRDEDLTIKTQGLYIYTGTGAKKPTKTRAVQLHGNTR